MDLKEMSMKAMKSTGSLLAVCFSMFGVGTAGAEPAPAAAAKCVTKVVAENDKYLVQDTQCAPGASSTLMKRPMRVIYTIAGSAMKRTYADGSSETFVFKDGNAEIVNVDRAYSYTNIGTSAFHVLPVTAK